MSRSYKKSTYCVDKKGKLKKRFANIYILLDNDKAGLEDGIKLKALKDFHQETNLSSIKRFIIIK